MTEGTSPRESLVDHLAELRFRIVRSLWFIIIGTVIAYNYSEPIFDIIRYPIAPYLTDGGLVFTGPADKFIAHIKIAFFAGIILSCPFWVYQLWRFIGPGLYSKEKKYSIGFIFFGSFLFLIGVCFSYFVVFPMAFKFLMTFGGSVDKPMITIDQYLSFFLFTTAMFGVAFELPLVITILGMMELVTARFLRESRRYAIVILSIICAVITPPDLLSMILMLIPMILLYEISILSVAFFEKKRRQETKE